VPATATVPFPLSTCHLQTPPTPPNRYHPGIDLLHAAAQHLGAQISAAEASGAPPPLPPRAAAGAVRSYASLAFAPPASLLSQLQALLLPALGELEPADVASVLWGCQLFRSLPPSLWNAACEALAAAPGGVPAAALVMLFQAGRGVLLFGVGENGASREAGRTEEPRGPGLTRAGQTPPLLAPTAAPLLPRGCPLRLSRPAPRATPPPDSTPSLPTHPPNQQRQVHLMVCKEPAFASYETPPSLIVAARGHWLAAQGSAAMLPPGDAQRDVQRCLAGLGVPHAVGLVGDDGLFALRLALPERCAPLASISCGVVCLCSARLP
jgi:hypothetical protein